MTTGSYIIIICMILVVIWFVLEMRSRP